MSKMKIYDNGGKTFDRYSVIYVEEAEGPGLFACRAMSSNPYSPQGFCQMSSAMVGSHLGKKISFSDLPADCQKVILEDLHETEN